MTAQELLAKYAAGERNFAKADLSDAELREVNLSGANLSGARLIQADLSGANLSGADLSGAILGGANLSRANLSDAELRDAELRDANLSDANLSTIPFNIAFRSVEGLYSFINVHSSTVESIARNKSVEVVDGLGGYTGYVKHGEITKGTSGLGIKHYYTKAEKFDVSQFELKGTVSYLNQSKSSGTIEFGTLRSQIDFEYLVTSK